MAEELPSSATQVDNTIRLESFRLRAWFIKFMTRTVTLFLAALIGGYGYLIYDTGSMPDLTLVGGLLTHVLQVLGTMLGVL